MEGLILISHKHMWAHNIRFRIQYLKEQGKTVLIMGPDDGDMLKKSIERWAKVIGADGVVWIHDLETSVLASRIQDLIIERSEPQAVLISEDVKHQAAADLAGAEFVRAFDWMD